MKEKVREYVSFVIYLHNVYDRLLPFLERFYSVCEKYFQKYEVILVDDASTDNSVRNLKWESVFQPTVIKLSVYHGLEMAMNAGVDFAVGDFVYEIDSIDEIPLDLIIDAYEDAIKGNDIVTVCPSQNYFISRCFYSLFNRNSGSEYPIRTDIFRIVSRRAINRVHSINENLPYRKAAYASSGLKQSVIEYSGKVSHGHVGRVNLAIDSLLLYTNIGFKVSVGITMFFLLLAVFEFLYTVIIFFTGHPIEGWTTTMIVLTFGMVGIFSVQTIIIKFLSLLLEMNFRKQRYRVESVQKISNRDDSL